MRLSGLNIVYSLLLIVLSACNDKNAYPNVEVIGHGGNGLDIISSFYHDNSFEAIKLALSKTGCDGVEVDIRLSGSGTLWLFHDANLSKEANLKGCVSQLSDGQLSSAHYKTIHKEKLVKLFDLPKDILAGKTIYFDLRHFNECANTLVDYAKVETQLIQFKSDFPYTEIVVFSQYLPWLKELKIKEFCVMTEIQNIEEYSQLISLFPEVDGVVSRNKNISKEEVSLIQSDKRKVVLFDMRSAGGSRKALKKGANVLITDNLNATLIERNL